jgi:hypothetical protein
MKINTFQPSEQIVGYSETLVTWTTRYIDPSGFECLLSLQAETGAEAMKRAESAIAHLTEAKCIPLQKDSHNGHTGTTEKKPETTVLVKADGNGGNPVCPIHGVEMTKWTKNGRSWHAHRWNDGWCNGKQK